MTSASEQRFGPIRLIPGDGKAAYPFCHSLFLEQAGVLIDPSSDREALARLRRDRAVKAVWLTHWHEDHWMLIDLFDDVPLWMSRPDSVPLSDLELFLDWYGMPPGYTAEMRAAFRDIMLQQFSFRPRRVDRFLVPGEVVSLDSVEVEVLHTPGHTPGHLALYFRKQRALFLADYDLTPFGPWYGDAYSSLEGTLASVERLRSIPARLWLTSHGPGVYEEEPGDLWDAYLAKIWSREEKLLDLLAEAPRSMEEILGAYIVYGRPREPKLFYEFGESAIVFKHLTRLQEQGRVVCQGGRYACA